MARRGNARYPHWNDQRAHGVQRLLPVWEYRYPRQFACARILAGLWFVILTTVLLGYHRGQTWAWLLLPCGALSFLDAWYIPRVVAAVTASSSAG